MTDFLSFTFLSLKDRKEHHLSQYRNKVILVVNTASHCVFTPQYKDLEELYKKYQKRGFIILGFPCNDFGEQEPEDDQKIFLFCQKKFHITFPMFSKISIKNKKNINPLFDLLVKESGIKPKWNFYKYLINRSGKLVKVYSSFSIFNGKNLIQDIENII